MRTLLLVLALSLATACAGPEAAWLGSYSGTYECDGAVRGSGEPYTEGPAAQTIRIEQDSASGRPFIAGRCPIWLDVRSETYAEPFTDSCTTVTPAGDRIGFEILGGTFEIREPELGYEFGATFSNLDSGTVVDINCAFEGVRVD